MSKKRELVYLFELDPRIVGREDVAYAYYSLFNAIFIKNVDVVLSYNQVADSVFIKEWYGPFETKISEKEKQQKEQMQKILIHLFEEGRIKIVQFKAGNGGIIKNPAQYVLRGLKNKQFIFSMFEEFEFRKHNYTEDQKDAIRKQLISSIEKYDPTILEYLKYDTIEEDDIEFLQSYQKFLTLLSINRAYMQGGKNPSNRLKFVDCVKCIIDANLFLSPIADALAELYNNLHTHNDRSTWYHIIDEKTEKGTEPTNLEDYKLKKTYANVYALDFNHKKELRYIIDICHNIAVESSIQGVSCCSSLMEVADYFKVKYKQCRYKRNKYHNLFKITAIWERVISKKKLPFIATFLIVVLYWGGIGYGMTYLLTENTLFEDTILPYIKNFLEYKVAPFLENKDIPIWQNYTTDLIKKDVVKITNAVINFFCVLFTTPFLIKLTGSAPKSSFGYIIDYFKLCLKDFCISCFVLLLKTIKKFRERG